MKPAVLTRLNLLLTGAALFISATFADDVAAQMPDTLAFEMISNRPVLDVMIDDAGPFRFAIDMGATGIGRIEKAIADSIGLPVSGTTSNFDGVATSTEEMVRVAGISIGPIEWTNVEIMTRDRYAHQGLLARGFFADRLLTIDYPNRQLIIDTGALNASDPDVIAYDTPIHLSGTVGDVDATFTLDTGSDMPLLFPSSFLEYHDIPFEETGRVFTAKRANIEHDIIEGRLKTPVRIGSIMLENQLIYHSDVSRQINLGGEIMKDFAVTFDQRNGLVALRR